MKTLTDEQLREVLQQMVADVGTQAICAEQLKITPQYLNDLVHGRRRFSEAVAESMGYKRVFVEAE